MPDRDPHRPHENTPGAEGGESDNTDTLPALPSKDDDSPLGDTDQHSKVPSDPAAATDD